MPRTHKAFTVSAFSLQLFSYSFNQVIIAVGKLTHEHLSTILQALIIPTNSKEHHLVLEQNFKIENLLPPMGLLHYIVSLQMSYVEIQMPQNLRLVSPWTVYIHIFKRFIKQALASSCIPPGIVNLLLTKEVLYKLNSAS